MVDVFTTATASASSLTSGWKVEIAIGDGTVIADVGLYDTSEYDTAAVYGTSGEADYLLDVTSRVRGLSTLMGRQQFNSNFKTGTARIVLSNIDGVFTPPAQKPIGVLSLRPGRVVVVTNGGADVWYGYIDSFRDKMGPSGDVVTTITAYDRMGQFARDNLPALGTPEGSGELSDARVRRLLDRHLDSYTLQVFGAPVNTLQSTVDAQPLGTELQLVAVSEGGAVLMLRNGDVGFVARDWFEDRTEEATDWAVGGASPIQIVALQTEWSGQRIVTEVHYSRVGGTEQVEADQDAIDIYGRRTHTRLDLANSNDADVQYLAARLLQFAKIDRQRITSLTFLPAYGSEAAQMGKTAVFGDTMLVTVDTMFGWSYTVPTQIFGVRHEVTDEVWTVTYTVDDSLFTGSLAAFDSGFDSGFN